MLFLGRSGSHDATDGVAGKSKNSALFPVMWIRFRLSVT